MQQVNTKGRAHEHSRRRMRTKTGRMSRQGELSATTATRREKAGVVLSAILPNTTQQLHPATSLYRRHQNKFLPDSASFSLPCEFLPAFPDDCERSLSFHLACFSPLVCDFLPSSLTKNDIEQRLSHAFPPSTLFVRGRETLAPFKVYLSSNKFLSHLKE